MSYARPSPRPGEIYDRYGPARPSTGNAYSYARSEAGGTRPSRPPPPPQHYPMAGPSYRGANSRPVQRAYDDAGFDLPPRQSPRRPPHNSYSKSSDRADFDYPRTPSRPRAMTDDRSRNFRQPPSSVRPYDDARDYQSRMLPDRGLPPRGERQRAPDAHYLDSEETGPALENNQDSEAAQASWSWDKIKQTVWGAKDHPQSLDEDRSPDDPTPETQNTLWTKLTTVVQKRINGDDGYASDASDYQGESHLIRIMKKYYTEKAESPHDLPDWLFTQAELKEAHSRTTAPSVVNPPRQERRPGRYDEYEGEDYRRGDPIGGGRGKLTDIYDSVDQDRGYHSRNGSSAKQSFDSGYGSSSNTPRRRGRYDDARSEFSESQPSLGRNRLAVNNDPPARYPGSNFNAPRRPINNASPYNDGGRGARGPPNNYSNEPRGFRNAPLRGAPAPSAAYPAPTVVDYFRPSGQDDRYPTPKSTNQRTYA